MDNIGTLCLLGIFLIVGLMLLPRLLGGMGGRPVRPEYDDPDIDSRGSFGGPAGGVPRGSVSPTHDDPNIGSRGSFGRSRGAVQRASSGGLRAVASPVDVPTAHAFAAGAVSDAARTKCA
ncbi:MAG: hypothetical protein HC828_11105 [Blastochloris sp.]|nr:hypothetical protein [Blastochloris sp.]